jgi:Restriction endonuclease fold toxin 3
MSDDNGFQQPGLQYEIEVQQFTGGNSQIIEGREIDAVTDAALIQAKDSITAMTKPHNFLNKKVRSQIKLTIELAQKLNKRAEFWFNQPPHLEVRIYIENKGGIVHVWSKEN